MHYIFIICMKTIISIKMLSYPIKSEIILALTIILFSSNWTMVRANDYVLEVGNLGDTEAADNADFNALEVPPGGVSKSCPSHPDSLVS